MSKELSQEQLEVMYNGKPADPYVTFFKKAVLDRDASKREGRRIYSTALYIKVRAPQTVDWTAYRAQKEDIQNYPDEYQAFIESEKTATSHAPGIDIIPNLDIAAKQELIDMGHATIPQLAEATNIPDHLEFARKAAIQFNLVLQEQNHASNEKESNQESKPESISTEDVLTADRPRNAHDVERPPVPRSAEREPDGRTEWVHQSRREHGRQGLNLNTFKDSTSFKYEFQLNVR